MEGTWNEGGETKKGLWLGDAAAVLDFPGKTRVGEVKEGVLKKNRSLGPALPLLSHPPPPLLPSSSLLRSLSLFSLGFPIQGREMR